MKLNSIQNATIQFAYQYGLLYQRYYLNIEFLNYIDLTFSVDSFISGLLTRGSKDIWIFAEMCEGLGWLFNHSCTELTLTQLWSPVSSSASRRS